MKARWLEGLRYLAAYLLPALVLALIVAGANLYSHRTLLGALEDSSSEITQQFERIADSVRFGRDLIRTQEQVSAALEQVAEGRMDQPGLARARRALLERFATLEGVLVALKSGEDDALLHMHAMDDFRRYRGFVLSTLDLVFVDSAGALDHSLKARVAYIELSEHINDLVRAVAISASERTLAQSAGLERQVDRTFGFGAGFLVFAVVLWLAFALRLTRHLRSVSEAMQHLAQNVFDPPGLAAVQALSRRRSGTLRALAAAVLSFRDALVAQRDSQALLRTIVEEAPCAIELVDADTMRFVSVNAYSRRVLGYSEEALLKMGVGDIQAEMTPEGLDRLGRLIVDKGSAQFETRHRRADGHVFDARVSVCVIRQRDGDYLLGIWQDISAEKDAQAELSKLSLVVEQSPNAVIITDIDANIEYVNDAFVRKTGYTREEAIGRNPRMLKSGKTPKAVYDAMWATLLGGEAWRGEFYNRAKDGSEQIEQAVIAPLRQADGTVTHYVAVKQDITQDKIREEERNRLFLAVEQSPDSIVITDLDARIEYVNQAFLDNTGFSRAEAIGKNPRVLQAGKTSKTTYAEMWRALTRGEPWRGELINKRKDGSEYVELAHIAPVRQPNGRVTHYLAIKQDITEKRLMAEELEHHRHHLEQIVAERSSELIAAKESAEVASRAKSEFLANMSHEIRTPMNAIIGLTHLLKRNVSDPRDSRHLSKIAEAAHHLLHIINDILDLSKIEAGRLELEVSDFEPERVVEGVVNLVRDKAEGKGLSLAVELGGLPSVLHGDALRLGQILLNFIGNAVKFTDSGGVVVHGSTVSVAGDQIMARFEVRDSGIGLTDEQRVRLFQPFEQADRSTTRKYGGTGLGLAISRRLVELMGGRIGVDSVANEGSTFWIEVPLTLGHGQAVARIESKAGNVRQSAYADLDVERRLRNWSGARVLLAEDNPINQEVAVELLTAVGLSVDVAEDGQIALEKARAHRYDLILMDMQMPVMDGLTASRLIRAQPSRQDVPILAMTANAFEEDRLACLAAGMNDHIAKPVDPDVLFDKILRWLPLRDGSAAGVSAAPAPSPSPRTRAQVQAAGAACVDLKACFGEVDGLDVSTGLRYSNGLEDLYLSLLRMFVEGEHGNELPAAIDLNDFARAHRAAHTLKGVAATLGAGPLREGAHQLEAELAAVLAEEPGAPEAAVLQERAIALVSMAQALRKAISQCLPENGGQCAAPGPHGSAAVEDWGKLSALFAQLMDLLTLGDLAVREWVREHQGELELVLGERTQMLEAQIEAFDFDEALSTLRVAIDAEPRLHVGARV